MYTVSDFIIRIKNAAKARRRDVNLAYSKMNKSIGDVLVKEGFLESIKENTIDGKKALTAKIAFDRRNPILTDIVIVSKPSLRVYIESRRLLFLERKRLGTLVLSTNKGIMSGRKAHELGLGGELLFEVI